MNELNKKETDNTLFYGIDIGLGKDKTVKWCMNCGMQILNNNQKCLHCSNNVNIKVLK